MRHCACLAALASLLGCASTPPARELLSPPAPATASASLRDGSGRTVADARLSQVGDSLRVQLQASGMRPGSYGAHIHAVGRCDAPDFASAGPHWNPTGQQHGKNNPQGMHRGDLPNLSVGTDGRGSMEINIPGGSMTSDDGRVLDADGSAVVIHERPDDYRTDPSGNSGARIACGVFR